MARLDTPADAAWPAVARSAEANVVRLLHQAGAGAGGELPHNSWPRPASNWSRTRQWWDRRREEFQIRTPDPHLNALMNWSRCTTEYHRQGPGLVLGGQIWQMYSHISTGWYGKEWAGDHAGHGASACGSTAPCRATTASSAGSRRRWWPSPPRTTRPTGSTRSGATTPGPATGSSSATSGRWCARPWPGSSKHNDPDGDGLFRDWYEYWNCDSNGKGPKAAAPSAMAWAMLDRAARLAGVVGDAEAEKTYRAAGRTNRGSRSSRELWREDEGRLGSIGQDGIWRGHPQTWEEYLAINAGLLEPRAGPPRHALGRRALRLPAAAGRATALVQRLVADPLEHAMGAHRRHLPGRPGRA